MQRLFDDGVLTAMASTPAADADAPFFDAHPRRRCRARRAAPGESRDSSTVVLALKFRFARRALTLVIPCSAPELQQHPEEASEKVCMRAFAEMLDADPDLGDLVDRVFDEAAAKCGAK
jgi:hypothetical protein